MKEEIASGIFSFSQWYHYLFLLVWMILLAFGLKYFKLIEDLFNPKDNFSNGLKFTKTLLLLSFLTGVSMVVVYMFKPANIDAQSETLWTYIKYSFYIIFIIFFIVNMIISFAKYHPYSNYIRMLVTSLLLLIYFYSGMFGGLIIVGIAALLLLLYVLAKFIGLLK